MPHGWEPYDWQDWVLITFMLLLLLLIVWPLIASE